MNFTRKEAALSEPTYKTPASTMRAPLRRFAYWINERTAILHNRRAGKAMPYTSDVILNEFKFCNVHREDDRVTLWIKDNWREPNYFDDDSWFAMGVARYINWPDTLAELDYPTPETWNGKLVLKQLNARQKRGDKVFTGAYMITNGGMSTPKTETVVTLLTNYANGVLFDSVKTLAAGYDALRESKNSGMGSFMAGQVIADCKHTDRLARASDWWDWACPGPGSLRGLERISGEPSPKNPVKFCDELKLLRDVTVPLLNEKVGRLCLQDLQNCLCEFDKYERTMWGEGRPRSRFTPTIDNAQGVLPL